MQLGERGQTWPRLQRDSVVELPWERGYRGGLPMLGLTRFAIVAIVVLVGCHTGRPEPAHATVNDPDTGRAVGGPGTICGLGERSQGSDRQAHECNPGLTCCYPCDIPGCDSVCMADCGPPRP